MPTSRDSCEGCHSKQSHQHDSIRTRKHYATDETSTETSIQLIMRTAAGHLRAEGGRGIHWHSDEGNQVRFISTDPQHQGLLLHSVYHRPNGWDYVPRGGKVPHGEASTWGDYHAMELAAYLKRLNEKGPYLCFFEGESDSNQARRK